MNPQETSTIDVDTERNICIISNGILRFQLPGEREYERPVGHVKTSAVIREATTGAIRVLLLSDDGQRQWTSEVRRGVEGVQEFLLTLPKEKEEPAGLPPKGDMDASEAATMQTV